jgi:riboflavin transporter FmnP
MAVFAALAYGVTFVFRIPVSFLTFDAKDAVLTIAAFMYGPLAAIIMALIPAFIELITISGTGIYGFLMNFLSTATFSLVASIIYTKKRNINGAIIGLLSAALITTLVMLLANIFVTPFYLGLPLFDPVIMKMIPSLILPFNLAKALMNSALALYLYKPVLAALRSAHLIAGNAKSTLVFNKNSKITFIVGFIVIVVSAIIFLVLVHLNK